MFRTNILWEDKKREIEKRRSVGTLSAIAG